MSQKEVQRATVIQACIKGDMACARAAGLLCLSVHQIKRLKKRMREALRRLLRKFITDYNRRFAEKPREMETAWRPAPESIERICCLVHERTVSKDNVVQ